MNTEPILSAADAGRQKEIIAVGDGWSAYLFAKDIQGADIEALQQVVLDHGDGEDAYFFARDITGADIEALQRIVMKRGKCDDVYNFAKNIPFADLPTLHNQMIVMHYTGHDTGYLDKFNNDTDIQVRLKEQQAALVALYDRLVELHSTTQGSLEEHSDLASQSEPDGNTGHPKHSLT